MQELIRFFIGGIVVSVFSALGEVFRPKSFAGIFAGAPSIALASLGLTIAHSGKAFAAIEARSMIFASLAFFLYASLCSRILMRHKFSALATTLMLLPLWFGVSFALLFVFRSAA